MKLDIREYGNCLEQNKNNYITEGDNDGRGGGVLKSGTEKLQGKINDEKKIINSVEY